MNTNTQAPSPAELQKTASLAFATHCLATGRTPEQTKSLLTKYATAKTAQAKRTEAICTALLGGVRPKMFAGA